MDKNNNIAQRGSTRKWHAWHDKKGFPLAPVFFQNGTIYSTVRSFSEHQWSASRLFDCVTSNGLFLLTNDILDTREYPYVDALLGLPGVVPFLSRSGGIPAISLKNKRQKGLLLSADTWKWDSPELSQQLCDNIATIFKVTGFQAATPASLSEKILRETLPDVQIYLPSLSLRRDILNNHSGGRIDAARKVNGLYPLYGKVVEYDKIKAYPATARCVPSPFQAPVFELAPDIDTAIGDYPCGFWLCHMVAHVSRETCIHPIKKGGENYVEGECFTRWLWTSELKDCVQAGYSCSSIERGYGFRKMSTFMEEWSDILWQLHSLSWDDNEHMRSIIKSMMVGLPGRFLRKSERLTLYPIAQKEVGDIPLLYHWQEPGDDIISSWVMRPVEDNKSNSLCHIGSYIVAEMRQELYRTMRNIEEHGGIIVSSYVDQIAAINAENYMKHLIGTGIGEWKEKRFYDVYAEENRLVARKEKAPWEWEEEVSILRAPGYGLHSIERLNLLRRYHALS